MLKNVFKLCIPTRATPVPTGRSGSMRYDGRLVVQRDDRVWLFTRNGHDFSGYYPLISEAALRNRNSSFVINGEAVLLGVDETSDFSDCIPVRVCMIQIKAAVRQTIENS
jgi:bifunctional non-homologous end joining protein LigD